MDLIASHPYVKVVRHVSSLQQTDTEEKRYMYLYNEKIVTKHREFPIDDVLDMSYRFVGKDSGMLYLHTLKGVYSYIVKTSPEDFVESFKEFQYKRRNHI
ncbi:hypothetical protein ACFQ4N_12570 [Oceanobacillus iheyensis]|uniref:Hypothetical conserved protein n=1 Tax=Oceanobacillus iheyensis (strain DSM 14371 / CIP 107618 / JCM 11309 / KCTC 3954 / HTE831) TaxID=221109 RepID=Q8ELR7_OCEIH|nr:hypothetical protein [Oceanobacillus iheyensis]BAC15107.1 hypothetical conserved protein [Oceanobacillus iheyensis HTE831]